MAKPKSIALVTGVSNHTGIGAAVCQKLAQQETDIFFTHWQAAPDFPERFRSEIIDIGVRCEFLEVDLAQRDAEAAILTHVKSAIGFPNILINNAAHSIDSNYMDLSGKILDDHYMVNMRATFLLSTEFAKGFQQTGLNDGRIINLTSGQEQGPMPGNLAYAATKGAISAFTSSLSAEVPELGITVNAVNPGPTDTNWMDDDIRDYLRPKFGLGRIGKPEDAANLIAFLASEEGGWITGQVIHSEGGFLRS
ncbi:SDR family oxidoreductase [Planococcus sp. CP5-4]|nr:MULTISPECIES: SDR family oxidoreductase [unclassified Planococcus (in: firmicutes)]MBU9675083.1 SDR family oxidoreductase [Planococcus sp. CP5-4_YE]MBV0910172.1 SDR family oxidoreductase [Planococcus sp. CP5-4_UN]MBW6064621.1 SDR family oxidoreductase [Planococcus sp. CP5-4]